MHNNSLKNRFLDGPISGAFHPSYYSNRLVLMTDFGTSDGSVSEVYGMIYAINPDLKVSDLSHHIPPFAIRTGAYRLFQVFHHWPVGTIFVCGVDPDVGTNQGAVVAKSKTGHYFVSPNNGLLTFVEAFYGLEEVILIDPAKGLDPLSKGHKSYGRDLYAHVAARLASGHIQRHQIGQPWKKPLVQLVLNPPCAGPNHVVGCIEIEDRYGNAWTNMDLDFLNQHSIEEGKMYDVRVFSADITLFDQKVVFGKSYAGVPRYHPILYLNSMHCLALGLNQEDFYTKFGLCHIDGLLSISVAHGSL